MFDDEARPQRFVVVGQAAAGVVAGGQGGVADAVDFGALPPVEFGDFVGRHAPFAQRHAQTERDDETAAACGQLLNAGFFEVVVMAVRNEDDIGGRYVGKRGDRRLEAVHHHGHGRDGAAEHGVGDNGLAADAHQQGGMAEPNKAAFALGRGGGRPASRA